MLIGMPQRRRQPVFEHDQDACGQDVGEMGDPYELDSGHNTANNGDDIMMMVRGGEFFTEQMCQWCT